MIKGIRLLFVFILFLVFVPVATAQLIGEIGDRKPCFANSIERSGARYVDWECGKSDQIVDCNERLESDPGSSIVLSRSSGTPYTGDCETCHSNGIRERVVHFVNGRTEGTDTTYYPSGCVQVVRTHIDGVENGKWTFYNDSSGLEAWQIEYLNGEKHGKSIYYSHFMTGTQSVKLQVGNREIDYTYGVYDRDTLRIEYYYQGKLHGTKTEYYRDGTVYKEVSFNMGDFHGPFLLYDRKGNLLQELSYENGLKHGVCKYYYDNAAIMTIENWTKGVQTGETKKFYVQGHLQQSESYDKNGRRDGWFEERYPDDKVKRLTLYKKGVLVEDHKFDIYGNEIETIGQPLDRDSRDDEIIAPNRKRWWQFWKKGEVIKKEKKKDEEEEKGKKKGKKD